MKPRRRKPTAVFVHTTTSMHVGYGLGVVLDTSIGAVLLANFPHDRHACVQDEAKIR